MYNRPCGRVQTLYKQIHQHSLLLHMAGSFGPSDTYFNILCGLYNLHLLQPRSFKQHLTEAMHMPSASLVSARQLHGGWRQAVASAVHWPPALLQV